MAQIIDMKKRDYKGPRPFRVDYFDPFKKRKRVHFKTRKEAERFLITVEAEKLKVKEPLLPEWFFNGNAENPTIEEIYELYLEKKIALKNKESAQATARNLLNGLIAKFGKVKAFRLSPSMVHDYQASWIRSGRARTTFRANIQALKTMLRWAVRNDLIAQNPLKDVEIEKGVPKEKEALNEDEIKRFIIGLSGTPERQVYLDYFILGINTGMRLGELWSLEWSQVDIEKRQVFIPQSKSKTNKARYIPLNSSVMEVINRLYEKQEHSPYVLWHAQKSSHVSKGIARLSGRFLGESHSPHYWRVTFATRALRGKKIEGRDGRTYWAAQDVKTVADVGGWEPNSKVLLSIYQKISDEQKRACVNLVEIGPSDIYREPRGDWHQVDTDNGKTLSLS